MLFQKFRKKNKKQEDGAVVIEATLSLTAFMFFIVTILSLVNICILQQKMGLALNMSAKEIAQYAYVYSLSGVNDIQAGNYEGAKQARNDIGTVVTGISDMHGSLMALAGGEASLGDTYHEVSGTAEEIGDTISKATESGHEWVISFLRLVGNETLEAGKGQLCGNIAKQLVQKNLVEASYDSADDYLKWHGITDGIEGIRFSDSVFMKNGSNDIILVADYRVRVLTLLNHDITLHFRQAAFSRAWSAEPLKSGMVKAEENEQPEGGETGENGLVEGGGQPGENEQPEGGETGENEQPEDTKESETGASTVEKTFTDNPFDENGKLKPNIKYKTGEFDYYYETDEYGRICNWNTDNLQLTERDERLKHDPNTPGKEKGDHAGHLAGDRFGGSPNLDNLVSQSQNVNLSQYKKIENKWAKALEEGKKVTVNVEVIYDADGLRPTEFIVEYTIDGEYYRETIIN